MKISGHLWKCLNIIKTSKNYSFESVHLWNGLKTSVGSFIAEWSSTYVFSIFYELQFSKRSWENRSFNFEEPQKKKKQINIQDKIKHTADQNP